MNEKYIQLLNGTLNEKIETFKQIHLNEERRKLIVIPCDPILSVDPLNASLVWDEYRQMKGVRLIAILDWHIVKAQGSEVQCSDKKCLEVHFYAKPFKSR